MSQLATVYRNIVRQAMLAERNGWLYGWTVVALLLLIPAALFDFGLGTYPARGREFQCMLVLAALAMFWWMRLVPGLVRQNSPANARLVPGLHRALRRSLVLAWCLALVPMAWFSSTFMHPVLGVIVLMAMLTTLGMARGGLSIGTVIYILIVISLTFGDAALADRLSSPALLAGMALAVLALAWFSLRMVLPAGGELHWQLLSAQARQLAMHDTHRTMRLNRARGASSWLYGQLLQRDLRASSRPEHLLLHALGPYNHRFDLVLPLLLVVMVAVIARTLFPPTWDMADVSQIVVSYAVPLLLLQGLTFQRFVISMDNTHGEQALVRLAPRAPRADMLGRTLGRQLFRICVAEWLVCGLALLALAWWFGAGRKELVVLVTLMCAAFASTGAALHDYAGKQRRPFVIVFMQIMLVGAGAFAVLLVRDNLAAWGALLALLLAGAATIVYRRWQAMLRAPAPFPAGRYA